MVQEALNACDFYAIDCEMTGLHLEGNTDGDLDGFEDRYRKLAANASQFLITQFGLSAFVWTGALHGYQARTFNFWLFPAVLESSDGERIDQRFVCQASSLIFLASQGFDFNKMVLQGVPFLSLHQRDRRLRALHQHGEGSPSLNASSATDAEARQLADLRAQVSAWLAAHPTAVGHPVPLDLPPASDRMRSLQRDVLVTEFGASTSNAGASSFSTEVLLVSEEHLPSGEARLSLFRGAAQSVGAGAAAAVAGNGTEHAYVRHASPAPGAPRWASAGATAAGVASSESAAAAAVREATGFSLVLELMRDCRKPLVGHNMMCDLGFMLQSFVEPLPRTWPAFKALVARWFPSGVYDTKHIALQLGQRYRQTDLASLYATTVLNPPPGSAAAWPPVSLAPPPPGVAATVISDGGGPAAGTSRAHEAGYDAYMTGAILARLARAYDTGTSSGHQSTGLSSSPSAVLGFADVGASPSLRPLDAVRNRIHMMRTDLECFALSGHDPIPSRPNVLHVTGFPARLTAREVGGRFFHAGFGQSRVTVIVSPNGKPAALVELSQPENPSAVAKRLQKMGWDRAAVQKFSEYYYAQQQQRRKGGGVGSGSSDTASLPGSSSHDSSGPGSPRISSVTPRGVTRSPPQALPMHPERVIPSPQPMPPPRPLRRLKISPPPGAKTAPDTAAADSASSSSSSSASSSSVPFVPDLQTTESSSVSSDVPTVSASPALADDPSPTSTVTTGSAPSSASGVDEDTCVQPTASSAAPESLSASVDRVAVEPSLKYSAVVKTGSSNPSSSSSVTATSPLSSSSASSSISAAASSNMPGTGCSTSGLNAESSKLGNPGGERVLEGIDQHDNSSSSGTSSSRETSSGLDSSTNARDSPGGPSPSTATPSSGSTTLPSGGNGRPSFAAVAASPSSQSALNAAQLAARLASLKLPRSGGSPPSSNLTKPQRPGIRQ